MIFFALWIPESVKLPVQDYPAAVDGITAGDDPGKAGCWNAESVVGIPAVRLKSMKAAGTVEPEPGAETVLSPHWIPDEP